MVLAHYGVSVSRREIQQFLSSSPGKGLAYMAELAMFAVTRGIGSVCFGYNLALTDPNQDVGLSGYALSRQLQAQRYSLKDDWARAMDDVLTNALEAGVGYRIARPNTNLLQSIIRQNIPLIATVTYVGLHNRRGDVYAGHTIVVNGWEGGKFWFIDPINGRQCSIEPDDLLFAILSRKLIADDAYMIGLQPR